jgi:gas vesicle protein
MNSGKVLLSVLAGAAAGALLGVLFAPHKGSVTRKKISRQTGNYADGVKEKINELLEDITEKFEKVKEDVSEFAEQKLHKTEEAIKKAKTA